MRERRPRYRPEASFILSLNQQREIIRKNHCARKDFPARFRQAALMLPGERFYRRKVGAMTKRTRISIETESLLVLRSRGPLRSWCPQCRAEVEMIALNEAGVVSNLPPGEVRAWIESADLHHTTTAEGAALICLNSMLKRVHRTQEAEQQFG